MIKLYRHIMVGDYTSDEGHYFGSPPLYPMYKPYDKREHILVLCFDEEDANCFKTPKGEILPMSEYELYQQEN